MTTTTYTAVQWAERALQRASIVAEDDVSTAAQSAWAQAVGTSLFDECVAQTIPFVNGSSYELPSEYYVAFTNLVACDLKAEVGLMSEGDAYQAKEVWKQNLRKINWRQPTGSVTQAEYF